LSEVGFAANLIAFVGENLNDTGENTVDELASELLLGASYTLSYEGRVTLFLLIFYHQEALWHLLEEDPRVFLLLPLCSQSSLNGALDDSNTGAKSLTSTMDESSESRNACLNDSLLRLCYFFFVTEPLVILHPAHDQ